MPSPSVTYTFSNTTTADATQVNTNFTDLINGMTDGTKDFSISALTLAGTLTANGAVTLGNSTSDDIAITGSLASSIPIKTTFSYDIGTSAIGLRSVYFGSADAAARSTRVIGGTIASAYTITLPTAVPSVANCVIEADTSATLSFSPRNNRATVSKTANYTATLADEVILCDATSGAFTITLPAAASSNKKTYIIKKTDTSTNRVTVDANSSETIDGTTTRIIGLANDQIEIVCDGSNWRVLQSEIVALRVSANSSTSIPNTGTATKITLDSVEFDSHNGLSSSVYTVPVIGIYEIHAQAYFSSGTWNGTSKYQMFVYKNGSVLALLDSKFNEAAVAIERSLMGGGAFSLAATDTIEIRVLHNSSSGTESLGGATSQTWLSIVKR